LNHVIAAWSLTLTESTFCFTIVLS
jgi:hypothetical protein